MITGPRGFYFLLKVSQSLFTMTACECVQLFAQNTGSSIVLGGSGAGSQIQFYLLRDTVADEPSRASGGTVVLLFNLFVSYNFKVFMT